MGVEFLRRIAKSNFIIRLKSWEYWPFELIYLPVFGYWLWLSLRARSLFFFSASNPSIENGGMLGESKIKILDKINDDIKPATFLVNPEDSLNQVLQTLKDKNIQFPIIAKPDIGERGWMVEKIKDTDQLKDYISRIRVAFLIQEYIALPFEAGVFYYRYPNEEKGRVSSIVIKEMLTVTGDGVSSIRQLILKNDRAKLQLETLEEELPPSSLEQVLEKGKTTELVSIGNHCKGTKFLNGNHLINHQLNEAFDSISKDIEGFYFGRFDLRCSSEEDLYKGNIKVMELNGAGSEPAHIYQPGFPLLKAYRVLFHHWKALFNISRINHNLGVPYMTMKEGIETWKKIQAYNQLKA